ALGVFPGGEVASFSARQRAVVEAAWSPVIGGLIQRTKAWVLPIFVEGRNSLLFQSAGLMHPRLRTALLCREMLRAQDRTIRLHVGEVLSPESMERFSEAKELIDHLRVRTELLRPRRKGDRKTNARPIHVAEQLPAIEEMPATEELVAELDSLGESATLARSDRLRVVAFYGHERPKLMRAIGIARERTFRTVGEGSGFSIDTDRYDPHYLQLMLWDDDQRCVAGGYRLGMSDKLVEQHGREALYTFSLFKYRRRLLSQIGPALELGRSFVCTEYQKSYSPLMLLWRGIGGVVAANPQYRRLFGPVSISAEYSSISRELLVKFLTVNTYLPMLGKLSRPRNPLYPMPRRSMNRAPLSRVVSDLDEVNQLISELESDGKAMPVLLRQYLKLNAKLLAFSVDPDFSNVVDGLMLVDLTQVDRRILDRYLGKEHAEAFLSHHQPAEEMAT
ncbi:MAG: lysophospholipid acyltransferase family protein, partial [Planctomycetota bacterium]